MRYSKYIFLIILLFYCSRPDNQVPVENNNQKEIPEQEMWNSVYNWTKNGLKFVNVQYGHMQKFAKSDSIFLDDSVTVDFFKDGEHSSVLYSSMGKIDEKTNNMTAIGNVSVFSDSGITLYTQELHWVDKIEKIKTDKFVTIITELDTIWGYGFESDQNLKNGQIFNVKGKSKRVIKIE